VNASDRAQERVAACRSWLTHESPRWWENWTGLLDDVDKLSQALEEATYERDQWEERYHELLQSPPHEPDTRRRCAPRLARMGSRLRAIHGLLLLRPNPILPRPPPPAVTAPFFWAARARMPAGARGVQFDEEWGEQGSTCRVRFAWPHAGAHVSIVRLQATTLPANGRVGLEQRERQAWRGLAWYLDSNLKAATFGLIPFEAIFLAHFEVAGGATVGENLIPQLEQGRLALPAGSET